MEGLRLSYLLALVAAVLSVDATGGDAVIKRQAEETFVVGFVETAYTVIEGDGQVEVCVNLTSPEGDIGDARVLVEVTTKDPGSIPADAAAATADNLTLGGFHIMVEGTDYPQLIIGFNPIKNMVITGTTRIICYNQIIYDDDRAEENEIFSLTMTVQTGSAMTTQVDSQLSSAIITILDDDIVPLISFTSTDVEVGESGGVAQVCLMLSVPLSTDLTVAVTSNASGSATGDDFVEETLMVTFSDESTVACVNFTITTDVVALEGNETFTVSFVPPSGTQAGTPATSTVTIIDDDVFRVFFTEEDFTYGEADQLTPVCVDAVGRIDRDDVTATISSVASGTATVVDDYLPITSFTITFSTIVPRRTVCEQVTLIDDNIVEATESFQFSFDAVTSGVVIDSPDTTTINIVDNDEMIACNANGNIFGVVITCEGVEPQQSLLCSFSGGPNHHCTLPLVLTSDVSPAGNHSVTITASPGINDTVSYIISDTAEPTVSAQVPPLEVYMINESPQIIGNRVEAEFQITRPVAGVRCFLRSQFDRIWQNCSSGQIAFSNLDTGLYVLKVQAFNRKLDANTVKRGFVINSDPNYCSLVLVNRGVTVSEDGSSAEVQFQLYGPATELSCVLDEGEAFTCANPLQLTGLGAGRHKLEVTPIGCSGGSKSLSVKFTT